MASSSPQWKGEVVSAAYHHLYLFSEETVEGRGDDIGDHGEGEEHHQHHQHDEQRPEQVVQEAQPIGQGRHELAHPGAEFMAGKVDQAEEQDQVDRKRQQHEQP